MYKRQGFYWEGVEEPVQYVLREVGLPWHEEDWRELSEEEQNRKLEQYVKKDRSLSFDLSYPPLMRVSLIRKTDDIYIMLWSQHHLLTDGWCLPIMLNEFRRIYGQLSLGESVGFEYKGRYRDYILSLIHICKKP